jgi:hypothetical protein
MKRVGIFAVLALALSLLVASVAVAASPHFKGRSGPTATDQGTTLKVTGTLVGLGQEGGTIELVAQGLVIVTCTNPSGKNNPPGQQPEPTTLSSGVQPITGVTKSGNFTFNLTTLEPTAPAGACKENFTATVTDVQFTSYTIVVKQGGQTTTLGPFTP